MKEATLGLGADNGCECVGYQAHDPSGQEDAALTTGQAPVKRYNRALRDLIAGGRAEPGFIVSHELGLDEAPPAYEHFDNRDEGWTKVILHPDRHG